MGKTLKRNTAQDFRNAGYEQARAEKLAQSSDFNWKAANGGERRAKIKIKFK